MDQTLLKYWKTCLQDAERKGVSGFSWLVSFLLSV